MCDIEAVIGMASDRKILSWNCKHGVQEFAVLNRNVLEEHLTLNGRKM